jgi:DNA-binding NarL/FixJ family response regulator
MNYTQLTREQRYQIKALLDTGHSGTEIAQLLEIDKSTVVEKYAGTVVSAVIVPSKLMKWH